MIIDAHLDLSMNAMEWNRDLRQPVAATRDSERGLTDRPDRGRGTVAFPELRRGGVGLVVATQIGRVASPGQTLPGWHSPEQAWAQTQGQLAWYKAMEAAGELLQVTDLGSLEQHVDGWQTGQQAIGYLLSLEGADSLITPAYVEKAYAYGLRALGPAHYGPGRYANGTNATGKMGAEGIELLRRMEALNIVLDATHLCDDAFWQALTYFRGPVWASHNNCRALVNHNRQFSDEMILELIGRDAVIGAALDAWMIVPGWERGQSDPLSAGCGLARVVDHIDHICQLAGNSLHAGIGSDLDGAFGKEQCPHDLEDISDLPKFRPLLAARGYSDTDIDNIMGGNWLRFLRRAWG